VDLRRRPRRHPLASLRLVAAGAALLVGVAGCIAPSRTDTDYQHKAANTAKAALSALGTAQLAAQAATRRRAPDPYLAVVLSESEQDLDSVQGTFGSVQPPSPGADQLRSQVDSLLSDAADVLSALRVAARRQERGEVGRLAAQLPDLQSKLHAIQERYQ
jgi:hypothetical protein